MTSHKEVALCHRICNLLNSKYGLADYHFEVTCYQDSFDISDRRRGVFIEVKWESLEYAQLIYSLARLYKRRGPGVNRRREAYFYVRGLVPPSFLGVADKDIICFFKAPKIEEVIDFAKQINPDLLLRSNRIAGIPEYNKKAKKLLGKPIRQIRISKKVNGTNALLYKSPSPLSTSKIRILRLLSNGASYARAIADTLDLDYFAVSNCLRYLEKAGFIESHLEPGKQNSPRKVCKLASTEESVTWKSVEGIRLQNATKPMLI